MRLFLLILALLMALPAVAAADSAAVQQLLESAEYWRERGRTDKLVEIWQKILVSDPTHATALAELSRYHASIGRQAEALEYRRKLEAAHPGHPALGDLQVEQPRVGGNDEALEQARRLVAAGRLEQAIPKYREYFGERDPSGELALEFYPTLGGIPGGWEEAQRGLQRVAQASPNNRRAALYYARHLTYREQTRRTGIARLSELEGDAKVGQLARDGWRDALLWLQATPADAGTFEKYLATVGEDAVVRERMSTLGSVATVERSRTARLDDAWAALEEDNLERAEAIFSRALRRDGRNVDALVGLSMVRMRQEEFQEARALLLKAKRAAPTKPEKWERSLRSAEFWSLVRAAETKTATGDYEEAEALLVSAQAVYPDEVDHAEIALGRLYTRLDRFADAEAVLQRVFERDPDKPDGLSALVELRVREGRNEEAQILNQRLQKLAPSQAVELERIQSENLRIRALFEREIGQLDRAIGLLLESRKMDDQNLWALFDLSQVYAEFGEFDASRGAMDELMALGAEVPEFHVANARLYSEAGEFVHALQALDAVPLGKLQEDVEKLQRRLRLQIAARKSVERAGISDQLAPARQRLTALERQVDGAPELMAIVALAWGEIGDFTQALSLMDSAVAQSMYDSVPLRLQRVSLLLQAGRHEDLETELILLRDEPGLSPREARDLDRLRVANFVRRADSATEAGDPELALIYLRPLLREDPESPQVLNALGRQLFASGAFREAESVFLPLLERDPDDMEARQGAILASLRLGRKRQASELIEQGIEARPGDAEMHLIAGRAEAMVGNDGKAMKHLREAQAMEEGRYVSLGVSMPSSPGPMLEAEPDRDVALAQLVRRVVEDGGEAGASGPAPRASLMQEIAREMEEVRARHAPRMNGGIAFRFRGGQEGLSRMTEVGVPVGVQFPTGFRGSLDVLVRPTLITSGALDATSPQSAESFGSYGTVSLALPAEDQRQHFGVAVGAAFGYRGYRVHVGSSPIGFRLPTVVGGFEVGDRFEAFGFRLRGYRETVNDSVLSYAGEEDPLTGKIWGAITRNGGDADLSLTRNRFNVYVHGGFFALLGTNVPVNTQWKAGGGVQWTVLDVGWGKLVTGVAAMAFGYKENLRFFSYGHGGYFSPQFFVNAHLPLMLQGNKGSFTYGVEAQIGLNWFREDSADWYPGRDDLMDARTLVLDADGAPVSLIYETRDALSFSLNASAHVGYRISPRLEAKLNLHVYTAAEYWEFVGGLGVEYRFGKPAPKARREVAASGEGASAP